MAMNRLFIFLLFIGFQSMVIGQTMVFVSLEGTVQDFDGGQKLIGATVNVIQNGVSISRVISDDKRKILCFSQGKSNSVDRRGSSEYRIHDQKNILRLENVRA